MRLSTSLALAALGLAASALPAAAGTLHVPQQFPTIQKALSAARPYDTVLVSAKANGGVYNEAVTISTPHVVLQGRGNPVLDITGLETEVYPLPASPTYHHTVYPSAIEVRADHVAVRGLTVVNTGGATDFRTGRSTGGSGVNVGYASADGQTRYGFSDIEVSDVTARNDYYGITIAGYAGTEAAGVPLTLLRGYRLLDNLVTGSTAPYDSGASVSGGSIVITGNRFTNNKGTGLSVFTDTNGGVPNTEDVLIAGNQFMGNGQGGLLAFGSGLTVAGNEAASNAFMGMTLFATNPLITALLGGTPDPANAPNTAPNVVLFNSVHDNAYIGLEVAGTQTVSGNLLNHNAGCGLFLLAADGSTVSHNLITGTTLLGDGSLANDGTGIIADSSGAYLGSGSLSPASGDFLTISANEVSGNAGDGINLLEISDSAVSFNDFSGNGGIGIHLSSFVNDAASLGYSPNTVTHNRALHNAVSDARDDAAAPTDVTYNGQTYYGEGVPTINVWTKNLFGTTDPKGLSK